MSNSEPLNPLEILVHCLTLLLVYAYLKQQLTFPFIFTLAPSMSVLIYHKYHFCRTLSGLKRAKFILIGILLFIFSCVLGKAVKNEGGNTQHFDDQKWIVRHRRCFEILILAMFTYAFLTLIDPQRPKNKNQRNSAMMNQIFLNIFSYLSTPLSICSGGACNSIYISTITSILSSFSVPLVMVVPILNVIGYLLQLLGLFSLYTANKWKSWPFWLYFSGMLSQAFLNQWIGIISMIVAVIGNARMNKVIYGKKIFKESII